MKKNDAILTESFETEILRQIIEDEKERLKYQKTDFGRKKTQERIMMLENKILPVVETETVMLYSEVSKYVVKYVRRALELGNDAVLVFIPLGDITDRCNIGVINPKTQKFGGENIDSLEIAIDDMGVGGRKIKVNHLDVTD